MNQENWQLFELPLNPREIFNRKSRKLLTIIKEHEFLKNIYWLLLKKIMNQENWQLFELSLYAWEIFNRANAELKKKNSYPTK